MQRIAAAALMLATLAAGQQTIAPQNPAHGEIRADKDGLVLPAGEFTVGELIEATASYLCRNYLYDYAEVERAGTFVLQRAIAVDALGSEELLYSLLSTRNFAVLPVDELRGVYGIVLLDAPHPGSSPTPSLPSPWRAAEDVLRRPNLREIAYSHIVLDRADAREVANMLRSMRSSNPYRPGQLLVAATNERFLMLHGYRDQVAGAIRLARQLDRIAKPPADRSLLDRIAELERRIAELEKR